MGKPLIYLANLTHVREGRAASECVPLNIGYLAAFAQKRSAQPCTIRLFNLPQRLEEALAAEVPDVLAVSNYIWNSRLNYAYLAYAKRKYPRMLALMGGPNYPGKKREQAVFLKARPEIDFYVHGEGEKTFTDLIASGIQSGFSVSRMKEKKIAGSHFLLKGKFVDCGRGERIADLDTIPSPYADGLLDEFLRDGFVPVLQTNRGCPFTCTYCCSSADYYTKVNRFSRQRVYDEIEYIGGRAKAKSLQITDDNYGMFEQDIAISRKLNESREKNGWPLRVNLSTSKVNKKRVYEAIVPLGEAIFFSASMQSMNLETLAAVKRTNLSFNEYQGIIEAFRKNHVYALCELILGLPEETKESHLSAIRQALDADIKNVDSYTCMLLANTSLAEDKRYARYRMRKKYRVIPRDFGEYLGKRVVESECVCVGTRSLSLKDYIALRGFHFIIAVYNNLGAFEEVLRYARSKDVSVFDLMSYLHRAVQKDTGKAGVIFRRFLSDARSELWDDENSLLRYYARKKDFQSLLDGRRGANLIQKYQAEAIDRLSAFARILRKTIVQEYAQIDESIVNDIVTFCVCSRGELFDQEGLPVQRQFTVDIPRWQQTHMELPVSQFRKKISLRFFLTAEQKDLLRSYAQLYGRTTDSRGKILTRINPKLLFKHYEYSTERSPA